MDETQEEQLLNALNWFNSLINSGFPQPNYFRQITGPPPPPAIPYPAPYLHQREMPYHRNHGRRRHHLDDIYYPNYEDTYHEPYNGYHPRRQEGWVPYPYHSRNLVDPRTQSRPWRNPPLQAGEKSNKFTPNAKSETKCVNDPIDDSTSSIEKFTSNAKCVNDSIDDSTSSIEKSKVTPNAKSETKCVNDSIDDSTGLMEKSEFTPNAKSETKCVNDPIDDSTGLMDSDMELFEELKVVDSCPCSPNNQKKNEIKIDVGKEASNSKVISPPVSPNEEKPGSVLDEFVDQTSAMYQPIFHRKRSKSLTIRSSSTNHTLRKCKSDTGLCSDPDAELKPFDIKPINYSEARRFSSCSDNDSDATVKVENIKPMNKRKRCMALDTSDEEDQSKEKNIKVEKEKTKRKRKRGSSKSKKRDGSKSRVLPNEVRPAKTQQRRSTFTCDPENEGVLKRADDERFRNRFQLLFGSLSDDEHHLETTGAVLITRKEEPDKRKVEGAVPAKCVEAVSSTSNKTSLKPMEDPPRKPRRKRNSSSSGSSKPKKRKVPLSKPFIDSDSESDDHVPKVETCKVLQLKLESLDHPLTKTQVTSCGSEPAKPKEPPKAGKATKLNKLKSKPPDKNRDKSKPGHKDDKLAQKSKASQSICVKDPSKNQKSSAKVDLKKRKSAPSQLAPETGVSLRYALVATVDVPLESCCPMPPQKPIYKMLRFLRLENVEEDCVERCHLCEPPEVRNDSANHCENDVIEIREPVPLVDLTEDDENRDITPEQRLVEDLYELKREVMEPEKCTQDASVVTLYSVDLLGDHEVQTVSATVSVATISCSGRKEDGNDLKDKEEEKSKKEPSASPSQSKPAPSMPNLLDDDWLSSNDSKEVKNVDLQSSATTNERTLSASSNKSVSMLNNRASVPETRTSTAQVANCSSEPKVIESRSPDCTIISGNSSGKQQKDHFAVTSVPFQSANNSCKMETEKIIVKDSQSDVNPAKKGGYEMVTVNASKQQIGNNKIVPQNVTNNNGVTCSETRSANQFLNNNVYNNPPAVITSISSTNSRTDPSNFPINLILPQRATTDKQSVYGMVTVNASKQQIGNNKILPQKVTNNGVTCSETRSANHVLNNNVYSNPPAVITSISSTNSRTDQNNLTINSILPQRATTQTGNNKTLPQNVTNNNGVTCSETRSANQVLNNNVYSNPPAVITSISSTNSRTDQNNLTINSILPQRATTDNLFVTRDITAGSILSQNNTANQHFGNSSAAKQSLHPSPGANDSTTRVNSSIDDITLTSILGRSTTYSAHSNHGSTLHPASQAMLQQKQPSANKPPSLIPQSSKDFRVPPPAYGMQSGTMPVAPQSSSAFINSPPAPVETNPSPQQFVFNRSSLVCVEKLQLNFEQLCRLKYIFMRHLYFLIHLLHAQNAYKDALRSNMYCHDFFTVELVRFAKEITSRVMEQSARFYNDLCDFFGIKADPNLPKIVEGLINEIEFDINSIQDLPKKVSKVTLYLLLKRLMDPFAEKFKNRPLFNVLLNIINHISKKVTSKSVSPSLQRNQLFTEDMRTTLINQIGEYKRISSNNNGNNLRASMDVVPPPNVSLQPTNNGSNNNTFHPPATAVRRSLYSQPQTFTHVAQMAGGANTTLMGNTPRYIPNHSVVNQTVYMNRLAPQSGSSQAPRVVNNGLGPEVQQRNQTILREMLNDYAPQQPLLERNGVSNLTSERVDKRPLFPSPPLSSRPLSLRPPTTTARFSNMSTTQTTNVSNQVLSSSTQLSYPPQSQTVVAASNGATYQPRDTTRLPNTSTTQISNVADQVQFSSTQHFYPPQIQTVVAMSTTSDGVTTYQPRETRRVSNTSTTEISNQVQSSSIQRNGETRNTAPTAPISKTSSQLAGPNTTVVPESPIKTSEPKKRNSIETIDLVCIDDIEVKKENDDWQEARNEAIINTKLSSEVESLTASTDVNASAAKPASPLDEAIATIDLTFIDDMDEVEFKKEIDFVFVKQEEADDAGEPGANEVRIASTDSGISSPIPSQNEEIMTYTVVRRLCICGKVAKYICECEHMDTWYCGQECQIKHWKTHQLICRAVMDDEAEATD